ncbi:MAG: CapA family protein [Eubacteriales bacterium]|nr:CapA family protein [Eubacteriales bacterium]
MEEKQEKKPEKKAKKRKKPLFGGDEDLLLADRLLKEISQRGSDEWKKKVVGSRKLIRRYYRKQKQRMNMLLAVIIVLSLILCGLMWTIIKGNTKADRSNGAFGKTTQSADSDKTQGENGDTASDEAAEPEKEPVEITMNFTGDCILGTDEYFAWDTGFNAYYEANGPEYFFRNVKSIFEKDDLTIVNMEGTLTEETDRVPNQFAFKGDPEFVQVLTNGSVEAANTANNHSHDYGEKSYTDTLNILKENNIATFGYDETAMLTVKDTKIGFFGIYELDDHLERIPQVKSCIAKLKEEGADLIIATFHWGEELETVPNESQITLGHLAVDEGADLVLGHHPHVLQGVEQYNGKTIAYSLGNFCFGGNTRPTEMDTAILQTTFQLDGKREVTGFTYEMIPCCVSSDLTYSFNNYQPTPLTGTEAERVMQKIQERSDGIGA